MRALLCFAALLICIAVVSGESCRNTGDCDHVNCESGHDEECHRGVCTCTDNTQAGCSAKGDCFGTCGRGWHCVDSKCRCGYGIGGNGRK